MKHAVLWLVMCSAAVASSSYEPGKLLSVTDSSSNRVVSNSQNGSVVTVNGRDFVFDNTVGIGNEHAWKIGVQYRLPTRTVLSAVYEDMKRDIPYHYFDERTRNRHRWQSEAG